MWSSPWSLLSSLLSATCQVVLDDAAGCLVFVAVVCSRAAAAGVVVAVSLLSWLMLLLSWLLV